MDGKDGNRDNSEHNSRRTLELVKEILFVVKIKLNCKNNEPVETMGFQSMGEAGKNFCSKFLQPLIEYFDRSICNIGIHELIPIFHNSHRKGRRTPSVMAHTVEYLVGVCVVVVVVVVVAEALRPGP